MTALWSIFMLCAVACGCMCVCMCVYTCAYVCVCCGQAPHNSNAPKNWGERTFNGKKKRVEIVRRDVYQKHADEQSPPLSDGQRDATFPVESITASSYFLLDPRPFSRFPLSLSSHRFFFIFLFLFLFPANRMELRPSTLVPTPRTPP